MSTPPVRSPFEECPHARVTKPRARTIAGGSIQYRRQCLDCGAPAGNPIAKSAVLTETKDIEPREFDEALFEAKDAERRQLQRDHSDRESAQWWAWYNIYLATEDWRDRRAKVLRRCGAWCEGCGDCPATHIHHLTYDHVGNELLFELVGLCDECHALAHSESSNRPPIGMAP
jgi:hypothetical protein